MTRHAVVLALCLAGLTTATLVLRACGPGEPPKPAPPAASTTGKAPTAEPTPAPAAEKAPENTPAPKPAPAPEAAPAAPPAAAVDGPPGKIVGQIKLQGNRPRQRFVDMKADPKCAALHADKVPSDEMVVGPNNEVQWAFVYISKGVKGGPFEPPKQPVLIDQVGCRYVPHVAGLMTGQVLQYRNSDELLHNVHGLPFGNRQWNLGQPSKGMVSDVDHLKAKEVMIKVKCDVHPWMSMWVGVLDHPYFAVSDAEGRFGIANVPPGRYDVTVWHEGMKQETKEVAVPAEGAATADFLLQLK
ncbi:MAG TPA: carboxypeptidase regulatory-like domain-containing protein [Planctomycetota bacterium]|nr:carboxypeptidase regulatory-like domain-containing protein [Planctomycetota bacterium]